MNYTINIGFIAAFLTSIAFIPQVIKVLRDKQTEGVSLSMYLMFVSGVFFWIVYGFLIQDMAILIANTLTFSLAFPVLIVVIKNKSSATKNRLKK